VSLILGVMFAAIAGGASSVAAYWLFHRSLGKSATKEDEEFGRSMAFRIGTVYALVLSLSFSTTLADFEETEESLDDEIVAIGSLVDIYRQLDEPSRIALVHEYWRSVFEEKLDHNDTSWGRRDSILDELYAQALTDLKASRFLAANALSRIETVRALRIQRIFDLRQSLPWFFWFFAIMGLAITLYATGSTFEPNPYRNRLVFCYGAMIALVLYMIYEMDKPYAGFYQLEPVGFSELSTYFGLDVEGTTRTPP